MKLVDRSYNETTFQFFSQLFSRLRVGEKLDFIRVNILTSDFNEEKRDKNIFHYQYIYIIILKVSEDKIDSTYLANCLILGI